MALAREALHHPAPHHTGITIRTCHHAGACAWTQASSTTRPSPGPQRSFAQGTMACYVLPPQLVPQRLPNRPWPVVGTFPLGLPGPFDQIYKAGGSRKLGCFLNPKELHALRFVLASEPQRLVGKLGGPPHSATVCGIHPSRKRRLCGFVSCCPTASPIPMGLQRWMCQGVQLGHMGQTGSRT